MKVIIVGCGRIGFMVARSFINQGCTDVSIVSQSPIEDLKEAYINSMECELTCNMIQKEIFYFEDHQEYPPLINDPFSTLLFSASIEKKRRYFTHRRN